MLSYAKFNDFTTVSTVFESIPIVLMIANFKNEDYAVITFLAKILSF